MSHYISQMPECPEQRARVERIDAQIKQRSTNPDRALILAEEQASYLAKFPTR